MICSKRLGIMLRVDPAFVSFLLFFIATSSGSSYAGYCWSTVNANNRCTSLLKSDVSREDCCSDGKASTAYSAKELRSGDLFFYRALRGGVPCQPCKSTCEGVQCGFGKRCVLRHHNRPACVCDSNCSPVKRKQGKVCGTDGRTYRNICKLMKRKCRKDSNLSVAYRGPCQKSCENVTCPESKTCIVDQNLTPHCVKCTQHCPKVVLSPAKMICGADNETYPSSCHLRQTACLKGKAIQVAYRGRCKHNASCKTIKCPRGRKCLIDVLSHNQPRCVTCPMPCLEEKPHKGDLQPQTVCASNNKTYSNWCAMMQESCTLGIVLYPQNLDLCQDAYKLHENRFCDTLLVSTLSSVQV